MNSTTQIRTDSLSLLATGRSSDLFLSDMESCGKTISRYISGARVLVVGGAGSIGAATIHLLLRFGPGALHVIDQNENALAELVRDLRSSPGGFLVDDFRALPLDYGTPLMHRFLDEMNRYDLVFNFAALKHVRSEKDSYSILRMLEINVLKAARFLDWLTEKSPECKYFCVSTDKAANPVSLMGASKRAMEHVIFSGEVVPESRSHITSARFANVAFSEGGLLDSFLRRLQNRRVLAVPKDTRRYFISLSEAGQICLIAAVYAPHRHLLIPRLDPALDMRDLESLACAILRNVGYEPRIYEDPIEAKANFESDVERGYYPLLLTERDTNGEKPFEEFVGEGESAADIGLKNLMAVQYLPPPPDSLNGFLREIESLISDPVVATTTSEISQLIRRVVPELRHEATGKSLDDRI
jgi:FlaA1/EpsC-like NDP-sugar epimerase